MATPSSHSQSTLPGHNLLVLDSVDRTGDAFELNVHLDQVPRCPSCRRVSRSFHSSYGRTVHDLPWQGCAVRIRIKVRRFRCRNERCSRKVFAERASDAVQDYARRTDRLLDVVRLVGYISGGLPGHRILQRLSIPVSDDTVLRAVKGRSQPLRGSTAVSKLGVDDWAWRKGRNYGTILVDLETHKVVDLLPERCMEEFRDWLLQHSSVEVITRDRCGIYAEAAAAGAPAAVQVADRFHLLINLSDAVQRALEERHAKLLLADPAVPPKAVSAPEPSSVYTGPQQQSRKQQRRQRRLDRYEEVAELHRAGYSQRAISDTLSIDRRTIRRWMRNGEFPERKEPVRKPLKVEDHSDYLQQRWQEGCHNASTLFTEIQKRGYRGGRSMLARYVSRWRKTGRPLATLTPRKVTPKHAAILACQLEKTLSTDQRSMLTALTANCPELGLMRALGQDFRSALFGSESSVLMEWIHTAKQSGIGSLVRFAHGMTKDLAAVRAAVDTSYSNGQVEGQVNRLKTLKRQMYGRAGFSLLRPRVLPLARAAPP